MPQIAKNDTIIVIVKISTLAFDKTCIKVVTNWILHNFGYFYFRITLHCAPCAKNATFWGLFSKSVKSLIFLSFNPILPGGAHCAPLGSLPIKF